MYCQSITECFEHISAYADGSLTGLPLLVNTENFKDYQEITHRLSADESKQCIYVSEHTFANGLPDIQEVIKALSAAGNNVAIGISQSMMLQGARALDEIIDELLGLSVRGHAIILLSHCRMFLEKYHQRDPRIESRILFVNGETSPLPQLRIAKSKDECVGITYDDGIRALISHLERITDSEISSRPTITVVTTFSPEFFKNALYAVNASGGIYDTIAETYPDIAGATEKSYGTDEQWAWLFKAMKHHKSFSDYIVSRFDSTSGLAGHLGDVLETGNTKTK